MNTKYISTFSLVCFLITFTLSQLILGLPMLYSKIAGTATVLLSIYIGAIVLLIYFIVSRLYEKFVGVSIFDICKFIAGNALYYIVSFLYSITFILMTIIYLRESSETIKILLFANTPVNIIAIFFVVSMVICAYSGIEGIIRAAGYMIPFAVFFIFLTFCFTFPYIRIDRIYPIFGNGIKEICINGISKIDSYIGFVLLYFIVKDIKDSKRMKKISCWYIGVSFALITLAVGFNTLIFSYPYSSTNYYSLYEIAKLTNLNPFFQRSEIMYIFALMIVSFFFLITMFHATCNCVLTLFKKKKNIKIYLVLGLLVLIISLLPKNFLQVINYFEISNHFFVIPVTFILPIILLIASNIKAKFKRSEYEKFISNNN